MTKIRDLQQSTTTAFPPCQQIVATLTPDIPETQRIAIVPHWRNAGSFTPAELSRRFAQIMKRVGEQGTLGRAFVAKHRVDIDDPFSSAVEMTPFERQSGMARVIRLSVQDPDVAPSLARLMQSAGLVQSVHPVSTYTYGEFRKRNAQPFPSEYPGSWAPRLIRASEALSLEPGSRDVLVAILDTGVEMHHPEVRPSMEPGYDFVDILDDDPTLHGDVRTRDPYPLDEAGHGTHVAGVVAAVGKKMYPGIGGQCRIMPVRVLGTRIEGGRRVGIGEIATIDDGIKYAVDKGADIINLSLGINVAGPGIPHRRAVEYARMHNVVVVAASGNDGSAVPVFPGAVPGVITVGAVNEIQRVAAFSSWGPFLDVVAPGSAIYSADIGGEYRYRTGTSHAAPFVTGVAALIVAKARREGLSIRESTVRRIIRDTADRRDKRRSDAYAGTGTLNALDAVLLTAHLLRNHRMRRRREPQTVVFA